MGGAIAKQHGFFVQGSGCGGSLVAPDVVLTAAHCVGAFPVNSKVMVGSTKRRELTPGSQARRVVGNPVLHPRWDENSMQYDLMMFKIEQVTEPGLTPIRLNRQTTVPFNKEVLTAIGTGNMWHGGPSSPDLLMVTQEFVPYEECAFMVKWRPLHDGSMLCAGGQENRSTRHGDSGSALFVAESEVSDNVLVGVTSWGDRCGAAGVPIVYAKVSTSIDWIQNTICALTDTRPSSCLGWADGRVCSSGTCSLYCRNKATYWYSKGSMACGTEPCLTTGTTCVEDSACSKCCNGYSWKNNENQRFFTSCD